jgi:hypothetical protein
LNKNINNLNNNDYNYLYKKRIFSSKNRKEKISNVRPSTANILSCDRRNLHNGKALNLGSFLCNDNLANKILFDINNNKNNNHNDFNSNNNFIISNNILNLNNFDYNNNKNKEVSYNNNINLNNNFKNLKNLDNVNNNFYNLNKIPNLKHEENLHAEERKKPSSNRPFTANLIRSNKNAENNFDKAINNNIINININVFNIQNNNNNNLIANSNRFLNPAPKTNLIYVNEDLKNTKNNFLQNSQQNFFYLKENEEKEKIKKNLQNLKPFASLKNSKIAGFRNNINLINFNNDLNIKKTAEVIFDNLAKTIGKGDLATKVLTIDDLK